MDIDRALANLLTELESHQRQPLPYEKALHIIRSAELSSEAALELHNILHSVLEEREARIK